MAEQKRRLAAILSADVAGYSRLMQDDEAATVETLTKYREIFQDYVDRHDGRIVDSPGDNVLAEFASPVEAVQSAVEIQRELGFRNRQLAEHRQMHFRIGVNLGDVIGREDGTLYGDGVNVAARLEGLAEAGGIIISDDIHRQVEGKLEISFADYGEHEVKNIARPVRAFRITEPGQVAQTTSASKRAFPTPILASATVVVLVAVGVVIWAVIDHSRRDPVAPPPSQTTAQSQDPILALPTGPKIAVLPFENLSGDPERQFFVDGLTEDLISALSKFGELFVFGRYATLPYKTVDVDHKAIRDELGADYILHGSLRELSDDIRVNANLVNAETGGQLWSKRFVRPVSDLFVVQDEITSEIVGAIGGYAAALERFESDRRLSVDQNRITAYELAAKAEDYFNYQSPEKHALARDQAEQAVSIDPDFSPAWATLAGIYRDEFVYGFNARPNPLERQLEAAQKAVETDRDSAYAHAALASAYFFQKNINSFKIEAEKALELNPNDTTVLAWMGGYITLAVSSKRGAKLTLKALKLNPSPPGWFYFSTFYSLYESGDYEAALSEAHKINQPGFYWYWLTLAMAYGQLGRLEEGRSAIDKVLELYPGFTMQQLSTEQETWNNRPELRRLVTDGLQKSGLPQAEPPATN